MKCKLKYFISNWLKPLTSVVTVNAFSDLRIEKNVLRTQKLYFILFSKIYCF